MNNAPADQHYYYNTSNMDEKLRYVEEAHKKRSPQFSFYLQQKIGATGFEPATSRPPAERATKLRHTPISSTDAILSQVF